MHSILFLGLFSILPLIQQGSTPVDLPPGAVEPVEAKPVPQDPVKKAPTKMVVIGCPPLGRHFLFHVPRSDAGLWLDPEGKPSPRLTALSLLVLAGEGEWARNGRYRREIRSACRTLLAGAPSRVAAKVRRTDSELYDDVLITLALYMQARKTQYKFIYEGLDPLMRRVVDDKRVRKVFPQQGSGSPKLDRARFAYLLLWKQIQVFRVADPDGAARDQRLPDLDVEPIRIWLDHGLKDQEADAERLLILFFGHLLLVPPKEPPLSAGITGRLWKRAQDALEQGRQEPDLALPPFLLFLDSLLRQEFLTGAQPWRLRKSRKVHLDRWEKRLKLGLTGRKGFPEDTLYHLMVGPVVYRYLGWW